MPALLEKLSTTIKRIDKLIGRNFLFIVLIIPCFVCLADSQSVISYPVYLCEAGNPNDYRLFANGSGWDGYWYVGYNRLWIEQFYIPEEYKNYKRVFIGAKLGRMKSVTVYDEKGKPTLDKQAVPGDIYVAISSTAAWEKGRWKMLAKTSDIPFEGDGEIAIEQVGESRWFWVEVEKSAVNFGGDNYVALWSTSAALDTITNSPVIAAAWGSKKVNSFVNDQIKGVPPAVFSTTTLKSALTIFEPAIALKFVPENMQNITIGLMGITENMEISGKTPVYASIIGVEISKAWLEISTDGELWEKHGLISYTSPFIFSLNPKNIKDKKSVYIRVVATNIWENTGYSLPVKILIVDNKNKK